MNTKPNFAELAFNDQKVDKAAEKAAWKAQVEKETGKPLEVIERDTERDNFMTADAACEYGLIDKVITKKEI